LFAFQCSILNFLVNLGDGKSITATPENLLKNYDKTENQTKLGEALVFSGVFFNILLVYCKKLYTLAAKLGKIVKN